MISDCANGLWLLVVYAPVTHWVWGNGWLMQCYVMDYAGGLVVHAAAGTSALILAILVGKRHGFPRELQPPHNPGMTTIGAVGYGSAGLDLMAVALHLRMVTRGWR